MLPSALRRAPLQAAAEEPGDVIIPRVDASEPLRLELEDFASAIRTGSEPRSNLALGVDIVAAVELATASIRENGIPLALAPRLAQAAA